MVGVVLEAVSVNNGESWFKQSDLMERKISPACLESCQDPLKPSRYFAHASNQLSGSHYQKIYVIQNVQDMDNEPTNMSHILFGIGGSVTHGGNVAITVSSGGNQNVHWLDKKPKYNVSQPQLLVPYQISRGWRQFRYLHSDSEVRIARIVYESFKLGLPNVRWFVMGDDDTVFFTKNLVTVLGKYDHNEMYYIGGNSESVEQDVMHAYGMAFGGGGFAISYALAAQLANIFDNCLHRYFYFYGSDQRVWACVSEIGVPLTKESGFHQLDIKGDPHGFLAAHPLAPLVSLHHLGYMHPLFPDQTQIDSVKAIMDACHVDPSRIMQQTFWHVPVIEVSVIEFRNCNLFVVGRRPHSEVAFALKNSEYPELRPVGGLLASHDFPITASVLVMQQYYNKVSIDFSLEPEEQLPYKENS
ncbi:hypothetical protein L6164_030764 [Bauhinia variegata]|uniref:Uncharacterized protein n=1 Tax=Bauhinia variegata TaxID=167791 RepID=A0ACB9LDQ7_BAUVA|nr:hypothetical protein L6164_030764 [Bauhinia variegata]